MNKEEIIKLCEPREIIFPEMFENFNEPDEIVDECCPGCGTEIQIKADGTSSCPDCDWKNVRPCSICPLNCISACDWNPKLGCKPFPNKK